MKPRRCVLLVATFFLFGIAFAKGQALPGIVGTITDASGAAIPGVQITVSNPEKGFTRVVKSNSYGDYTAPDIPIGNYVVTAQASGFQKLVRRGITLQVGQTLRLDLTLKVGTITQEVTVSGSATKLQTQSAVVSDVVTGTQLHELGLNGRNFTALALLTPGATPDNSLDTTGVGLTANVSISFNGVREQYNNWSLDGAPNADETSGTTINTFPDLDSIAEFRVSTSNYGADLGKHAGAVIQVVTKSGTNKFHGDLFEFVRNDAFDANNFFTNRQINPPGGNAPKTPLQLNNFGYTLGGPIYIPHLYNTGKSKTFFFWSQSWRRQLAGTVVSSNTPSLLMRQGDFSQCDSASPNFNAVAASGCVIPTDPTTGQPFSGDIVPIDPNTQAIMDSYIPKPNNGVIGYVSALKLPTDWREEQIRVDQNVSEKTSLFVRYTQDHWERIVTPSLWSGSSFDTTATDFVDPSKSMVLHLTHIFKPNLLNTFIMGWTNDHWTLNPQAGPANIVGSINRPANFTISHFFSANDNNPLLPAINVSGGTSASFSQDTGIPAYSSQPTMNWQDNVMWSRGRHMLKFGVFFQYLRTYAPTRADTQGSLSFSSGSAVSTGNALADFYLGRIGTYTEPTATINGVPVGGLEFTDYRQYDFEPYFQDDWRVNRRLTLNLGLRYYYFTTIHDYADPSTDAVFDPSQYNPALEASLNSDGNLVRNPAAGRIYDFRVIGNGLIYCGHNLVRPGCQTPLERNFGPRFGFAFDPMGNGKTVIRGGYGIYYEMGNWNEDSGGAIAGNPPLQLTPSIHNIVGYSSLQPPSDLLTGPIPPPSIGTLSAIQHWPQTQQFNLTIQHQFPGNNLLSAGYVGTLGRHLARGWNLNQVPIGITTKNVPALAGTPGCDSSGNCNVQNILINNMQPTIFFVPYGGYGGINSYENTAVSNYNSLQVNFRHTAGHGLTFQAAYTYSHAIDDSSSVYATSGVDDSNLSRWRATSDFNRTQMLVMNYIYELPFFKKNPNGFVKNALAGWELSGITTFMSGPPVDFYCGISGLSSGIGENVRCNSLGKVQKQNGVINDPQFGPTASFFDPSTIGQVRLDQLPADGQPGMFGTMGRNPLDGPGRNNWDIAILKNFSLPWFRSEKSNLQFRGEMFNAFNHTQYRGINAGCSGTTAPGQPCNGPDNVGNGEATSAFAPRIIQLGLKLIF